MKTYQLAIREIAAAHEKLGEPMKQEMCIRDRCKV